MWSWIVKGLGGILNMAESLSKENAEITDHWLEEIETCQMRLSVLVNHLARRIRPPASADRPGKTFEEPLPKAPPWPGSRAD